MSVIRKKNTLPVNPNTDVVFIYGVKDVKGPSILTTFNAESDAVARRTYAYIASGLPAPIRQDAVLVNLGWFYKDGHDYNEIDCSDSEFFSMVNTFTTIQNAKPDDFVKADEVDANGKC